MKRIKKILASFMVVVMVLTAAPLSGFVGMELNLDWLSFDWFDFNTKASAASYSGTCGDNLTWSLDTSTGELVISGTGEMKDYSTKYSNYSYITTAPWGSYVSSIRSVTIQNGATSIGSCAFYGCKSLTSIAIPDSVTSIGDDSFYRCTSLTSVTIPDSVTSIGYAAFYYCTSLTSITIPDSVTSIGYSAFYYCTSLTSITIPDSVTSIGFDAFYNCTSLTNITIPNSVTSIGNYAFSDCTSLTNITIPDSVTSIGDRAFYNCTSLTSITIPDSVTSIGNYAFNGCNTAKVYYTGTKDKWNSIALGSSIGLNTIVFECNSERPYYDLGKCGDNLDWILYIDDELIISGEGEMTDYSYSSNTPWYSYWSSIKKVTIGNGVTSIGSYVFYNCTSLTSITIPDSVTSISPSAFRNTGYYNDSSNWEDAVLYIGNHLIEANTSISGAYTIKEGTMSIGPYAFEDCTSLTSITIPDGVTSIGYCAFKYCYSLTSITIPDSVTSIGGSAFDSCQKLEKVIFKRSDYIELGTDFLVYSPNAMICCEANSYLHTYAGANNLKYCLLDENGVPSYEIKNDILLSYRGEATDVSLSTVTKIGYGAFENNSVVETVVLSSSVYLISANAFRNCSSLETIVIPESVTSIGAGVFDGCDNLTIWCYAGSYADSYATANEIDVEYIALDIEKDILIITFNGTSSLTASLNTPYAENIGVVWSSTNTSIATVDGNGNVRGIKAGTAVIVATSKEGGLRDYCVVKVVGIEALSSLSIDFESGIISGLSSNTTSLDGLITMTDSSCNLSYTTLGTDSVVYVERDNEIVDAYTILIYGDVNGDSWYDGQDAIIVDCLANGMLTKDDVSEAVYMAADCNHDGVIDQADVALLNEAGTLLANVDQTKPAEVLLETSAEYVEYISLIDQSPEIEIEDETETPEADTEDAKVDIFEMILNFIKSIFEMLLSYIPMPIK